MSMGLFVQYVYYLVAFAERYGTFFVLCLMISPGGNVAIFAPIVINNSLIYSWVGLHHPMEAQYLVSGPHASTTPLEVSLGCSQ